MLRTEHTAVPGPLGEWDATGAAIVDAVDYGFLEGPRSRELVTKQLDRYREDGTEFTLVYDDDQDPRSIVSPDAPRPVGTLGAFRSSVTVAPQETVPASLITEVTVRQSHRRRGILSTMMRSELARAREEGLALAGLTATEGGIYGRYGFGVAAFSSSVTIDCRAGLTLRPDAREALQEEQLQVIVPSFEAFGTMYEDVYAAYQENTVGQIGLTRSFRQQAVGDPNPRAERGKDEAVRALAVLGPDGAARAVAVTVFAGWQSQGEGPVTLKVKDFFAADPLAELALWEALASTDLVERLSVPVVPVDFALGWALADPRAVHFVGREDALWLRILDLPGALSRRGLREDGRIVLKVTDRLGMIDGEWEARRSEGVTTVTRRHGDSGSGGDATGGSLQGDVVPVLALDAEALASLYLGAAGLRQLLSIGRVRLEAGTEHAASRLLDTMTRPFNSHGF